MRVPDEWFPGGGTTPAEQAFLVELRRLAETSGLVDAPGLSDCPARPTMEVVVHLGPAPLLGSGWETNGCLADPVDPMDVEGLERSPQAFARRTYDWFDAELRRPLERATWRSRWSGGVAVVRYADSQEPLWGQLSRRQRNRPPDEVVRLR